MKETKPELRKLIENWLWSTFSRKSFLIAPGTWRCLFSRYLAPFHTLALYSLTDQTGLDSEYPGAKAWGLFLSFDLTQCPIQRRSTLNIYVISEWMKCLWTGMRGNEGVNACRQIPVFYRKPFLIIIYTCCQDYYSCSNWIGFYERFSFVFTKNPHTWVSAETDQSIFPSNWQHSQSLYCVK